MIRAYKEHHPQIANGVFVADNADIIGKVTIKNDASIWFQAVVRGDIDTIYIGKGTNVQEHTLIHVGHGKPVFIGENVTIGHRAIIHGCQIEDNCLIGMGAIILDGARIGKNSIVGAGSLITQKKEFPENSLIMGSPAKRVRQLTESEKESLQQSAQGYILLAKDYLFNE